MLKEWFWGKKALLVFQCAQLKADFHLLRRLWGVKYFSRLSCVDVSAVVPQHGTFEPPAFLYCASPPCFVEKRGTWPMGACTQNLWECPVVFWHWFAGNGSLRFCGFWGGGSVVWACFSVSHWCLTSLGFGGFEAGSTPWTLMLNEPFLWWRCPAMRRSLLRSKCFCGLHQHLGRWNLSMEYPHE